VQHKFDSHEVENNLEALEWNVNWQFVE